MEVDGQLHDPITLLLENKCRYPLTRRNGGPQSQSGILEKKKLLTMPVIDPQITQSIAHVNNVSKV
jgi:hypothetical protein